MSAVTFRVDDALKSAAVAKLSAHGLSLSDVLRDTLAYIAETGQPPVKRRLVTDEDASMLIEIVRERLADPAPRHRMTLAELKARHPDD
ncbi:type II toxin-antitoxin system RelB/DinJ family antitoxin (plasmid) [Komagataeibacter sucrofermentans]|uniref:Bifunctional antitoxin/transcriptional repressor RelB n=1 Tax=Komagataeibacter sucrofermentans TaxID=1053551 RepID=A0A318QXV3_9PROT|nr:type II toxin-antitoxin system RelB/DinJ family antitoxin [Komagataeibacter sucrofermentans]PYD77793.1 bifunctional antitoxin/transcriptional repressor RelB [Komagataeibacter sucrofermentans]GBQ52653.1 bifunctional antitoxin/transcriptional repressor RelB [Komagataeibacter sucrofermentans DSM 15973]